MNSCSIHKCTEYKVKYKIIQAGKTHEREKARKIWEMEVNLERLNFTKEIRHCNKWQYTILEKSHSTHARQKKQIYSEDVNKPHQNIIFSSLAI